MNEGSSKRQLVRFGPFEVNLQSGELRKSGVKVRIQEQPFRVLRLLLECPGEVVTRDQLREKLWSDDTFVEIEQGLNAAVNSLRATLSDSANDPRWIETLPRRGYRFLGTIEPRRPAPQSASATDEAAPPNAAWAAATVASRKREIAWVALAICITLAFLVSLFFRSAPTIQHPVSKWSFAPEALATRLRETIISPNGNHIAFRAGPGLPSIWIRDIDSEAPRRLPGTVGVGPGFF